MRRNRDLLGSIQEAALVGGRAPVWWQREINRSMAQLYDLQGACAWLESWETAVCPTLRHEPLLGRSLGELTDKVARRVGLEPYVPRPGQPRSARPEYRAEKTILRRPTPVPVQLEPQASGEVLSSLAAGTSAPAEGPSRLQGQPIREPPESKTSVLPSVSRNPEIHRDWLHDLCRWADRSVGQRGLDVSRTPRQVSPDQQDIGEMTLLDHSLAELTGLVTGPAGSKPEKTRPRQPRFTWPEYRPARNREMAPASKRWAKVSHLGSSVTAQQVDQIWEKTPGPIQMESRASQALLYRLAGATAVARNLRTTQRRPTGEPVKPKAVASPSVPRDPATHRDWLHDLAERAGGSLLQEGHDVLSAPRYTSSSQLGLGALPSLADQWAIPLNGPPASLSLLGRLVCMPEGDGSEREMQAGVAPRRPPDIKSTDQDAAPATEHARPWHAVGVETTPQIAGKPSALAATAIIQGVARHEEAAATENDQSALATKIKRILDEEARRHGIDV